MNTLDDVPSHKLISETAKDKSGSGVTVTVTSEVKTALFVQP